VLRVETIGARGSFSWGTDWGCLVLMQTTFKANKTWILKKDRVENIKMNKACILRTRPISQTAYRKPCRYHGYIKCVRDSRHLKKGMGGRGSNADKFSRKLARLRVRFPTGQNRAEKQRNHWHLTHSFDRIAIHRDANDTIDEERNVSDVSVRERVLASWRTF